MLATPILSEMDWDEGIAVPVANEENQALEKQLMRLQAALQHDTSIASNLDDRIRYMEEHMKNVQQELKHNSALLEAHGKEIDAEEHMFMLAGREEGRLKQEQIKMKAQMNESREKRNSLENKIFTLNQQLEGLKKQINWDQQALEAWLEESARRDEDAIALKKYSTHDNSKLKQLSLQIEKMTEESMKKRMYLEQESTATLTTQMALDKAAEEFRDLHHERKEMIQQWEKTIELMQRRDKEMDIAAAALAKVKEEVRSRELLINEKLSFLDKEKRNNEELERNISHEERQAAKLRLNFRDHENIRTQLTDELDTLKYTVERTASDLQAMKSTVNQMKKEISSKEDKLDHSIKVRVQLQNKLANAGEEHLSAEERADIAQQVFEEEEQQLVNLQKSLTNAKKNLTKMQEEVHSVMSQEKVLSAEIQGSRASNRNLASRLKRHDQQSIKQQEIVYGQDFTIQQLQRRLARLEGQIDHDEAKLLEEKLESLTTILEDRKNALNLIISQLKTIRDQTRQVSNAIDRIQIDRGRMDTKICELELHLEISLRLKNKLIVRKHDEMVNNNILKLEVHRAHENFNEKADTVMTLEKKNLQLQTAMKERQEEITVHKEMLFAQIKAADEERSTINIELHQRNEKIEKLKKRYEIFTVSMKSADDEERSAAYYVIKAAQAKEELQRTGDNLDAKIRKAEKEIRALENTLRLLNNRNDTYKKNFSVVTETSEEYEKKSQLEEQLRSVMDTYKYKRRQIRELQEDLQTMSSAMDTSMRDESAYQEMLQDRNNKIKQLEKDLVDQQGKLDRVYKQLGRCTREARSSRDRRTSMFEEKDMDVRELRERNKQLNKAIYQVIEQYPDIHNTMDIYFQQIGLPTPTNMTGTGSSRGSSRSGSVRSSRHSTPRSSASSTSRTVTSPKAVDLGLGLKIASPPGSRQGSDTSSVTSARSVRSTGSRR